MKRLQNYDLCKGEQVENQISLGKYKHKTKITACDGPQINTSGQKRTGGNFCLKFAFVSLNSNSLNVSYSPQHHAQCLVTKSVKPNQLMKVY